MEKVNEIMEDILNGILHRTNSKEITWEDYNSPFQNKNNIHRKVQIDDGNIYIQISITDDGEVLSSYILLDFPQIIDNKNVNSVDYPIVTDIAKSIIDLSDIKDRKKEEISSLSKLRNSIGKREYRNRKIDKITNSESKPKSKLKSFFSKLNPFRRN